MMKKHFIAKKCIVYFFLFLGLCISETTLAQQNIEVSHAVLSSNNQGIPIHEFCPVFIDSSKYNEIEDVLNKSFQLIDFSRFKSHGFDFGKMNLWYKIDLQNTDSLTLNAFIIASKSDKLDLFYFDNNVIKIQKAGFGCSKDELSDPDLPYTFKLVISPQSKQTFFLKVETYYRLCQLPKLLLFSPENYQNYQSQNTIKSFSSVVLQTCFLACLLFMLFFVILQFSRNYYLGYVYYGSFIIISFFIFLRYFEYNTDIRVITSYFPSYYYCSENILTAIGILFYLKFVAYFLETATLQTNLDRFINVAVSLLFIFIVADFVLLIIQPYNFNNIYFFALEKTINYSILLITLVLVLFNKNILSRYIFIGTISLFSGLIFSSLVAYTHITSFNVYKVPIEFSEIGVLLEILFLSFGLGHKSRLSELGKTDAQVELIKQLQENQKQQLQTNEQLEDEVKRRTDEVLKINKHYEDQRIQQMRANFQKKIIETEMAALRAQMNPHFIFNCLNSINLFILKSEPEIASDYLTKFSRLIRLALDNSRSQLVTLSNEIMAIKLYIEMEDLRFSNKFVYEIIIDDNIDIENTEIPPMLLQPYVENAIWHGLMQYGGEGKITLHFSYRENQITVIIDDNGIGRSQARRMKSKSATEHKSHGMKVTADRIDMINKIYDTLARVEIIDKTNENGEAFGTTVKIQIPLKQQY